ncbi:MAG: manganese efflux pump, partial [Oscillospiraceae bacterium]|nr:manganese efflux pump [Oscillospiraceae bacterium]
KARRMCLMAGVFSLFQFVMPMIGWVCVHSLASHFKVFADLVPWIALALLSYIGGKMLYDGIKNKDACCEEKPGIGLGALIVQGIATSIDALSVGFTICQYGFIQALVACLLIGLVTFICAAFS